MKKTLVSKLIKVSMQLNMVKVLQMVLELYVKEERQGDSHSKITPIRERQ